MRINIGAMPVPYNERGTSLCLLGTKLVEVVPTVRMLYVLCIPYPNVHELYVNKLGHVITSWDVP